MIELFLWYLTDAKEYVVCTYYVYNGFFPFWNVIANLRQWDQIVKRVTVCIAFFAINSCQRNVCGAGTQGK